MNFRDKKCDCFYCKKDFENICIVGTGAIGSVIGVFLSNAGYDVKFVEKNEEIINEVKENGISISVGTPAKKIHLKNVSIGPNIPQKQDLIIFAVKAYSLSDTVQDALPYIGEDTFVACIQNGLGINEIVNQYINKEQIIEGAIWFPATMVRPGFVRLLTFYEESIFGGRTDKSQEYAKKLALLLNSIGIPARATDNISMEIWRKAIPIIVGNSINAITRKNLGVISEIPELRESLIAMTKESLKIAVAEGIELDEDNLHKSMDNAVEKGYEYKTSMLLDILNNRKTEVDFLNGKIVELGKKHNIQTPLNLLIYGLIKAIEG